MERNETVSRLTLTVGHSTRSLEDFIDLLRENGVTRVVDVRTVPLSRYNPQFNRETLPDALRGSGIEYLHMPGLGGLRHPRADSPNTGWHNDSFRGFADYMQTAEFEANLEKLMDLAEHGHIALLCAEAVPWRCHRSLIADALTVRGKRVEHIMGASQRHAHELTPWAKVDGTAITYPPKTSEPGHGADGAQCLGRAESTDKTV